MPLLQAMRALQDMHRMVGARSDEQCEADRRWANKSYEQKIAEIQAGTFQLGLCLLDRAPGRDSFLRTIHRMPSYLAQVKLSN